VKKFLVGGQNDSVRQATTLEVSSKNPIAHKRFVTLHAGAKAWA
jgi:hypothetical protein